ncbi:hypothetical protein [Spiroplasma endosymbiont of Polydrusus pterygomalis]|uniref:hypothetical protein n=1 Tax=Spiroplasma endosymbiont of Polydrusus pterygomalis TaxID=3139327 RepID=UPI003CCB3169
MKKILSLLSVLTITGTAIPNVIAASTYQKIENINNKRQKRSNNENDKINRTKIVITTNGGISTSGIILNNKVYFGSLDYSVYEYDPVTEQQKIVITTGSQIWSSGVILNNKIYIGSYDNNVYEYDPVIKQQKVIIKTNGWIASSGVVFNNKLYFGSGDKNVYEYDPVTEQQKVVIKTNGSIKSSGVVLNNKLYIGSQDKNVYEYDPVTEQQKVVIKTEKAEFFWSSGVVLNNKIYFGSDDHNVYEYDPVTEQQKVVIKTNSWIESSGLVLNNKIYFGSYDKNVYEYDQVTEKQKIVIRANGEIWCSGVVFNNKVYFGSWDHNVYEYDPVTEKQKIAITTNDKVASSGVVLNNKIYFGSDDNNVYEYDPNYYNLGQINNNFDSVILNELNYLNPELDISQLEIINKTNNSAIVKEKNNTNKYFAKNNKIYYIINQQNKIVNLNELIKKSVFFKFRDENHNLKFKKINYINTNNLNFGNIEAKRNEDLNWGVNYKSVCFTIKERKNNSSIKKTVIIPKCEYNQKSKFMFQIIKGISKDGKDNLQTGWTLNMDNENKLWDFVNINYRDETTTHTLSNNFDFSNLNKQEQEMILYPFNEPEEEIELAPNEKTTIVYSVRESKYESTINLKQKIIGTINVEIINGSDNKEQIVTLSIKEAMQILQKYSLLPDEIIINEDNSITFNGKAILSLIRDGKPKLILNTEII